MNCLRAIFFVVSLFVCTFGKAQTSDSVMIGAMENLGVKFSKDNSVTLLDSGREKFDDLFKACRQATSSIHMEYFNFRNDSITGKLIEILKSKVSEGVEVRLLFDAFGNESNNRPLRKHHLRDIRESGVEIYQFDPIKFPYINHVFSRDHRKIVVIDGEIAYTGGMNVADYYITGTKQVGQWRDMHCRIEGQEVNTLQAIFLRVWNKVTHQNVNGRKYFRGSTCKGEEEGLKADTCASACHKTVGIINREPRISPQIMRQFYVTSINAAKDSIEIVNPYFTLVPSVKRALNDAIDRGIKVEIMLSVRNDIPITPDCGLYNAHQLMKRGAYIWMYKSGFHHSKVMMIDGRFCTVGSANLDARSMRFDYESNAVIADKCTTAQLIDIFNNDKKNSFLLTPAAWNQIRTPWQRFRGWFAHLLSPFL